MCVLQCVAVFCSVLQCVAVCCFQYNVRDFVEVVKNDLIRNHGVRVAVCCSVLQRVAACCSVLQCVTGSRMS